MRSGRNNVLAGVLVLTSIITALFVVILLAGGLENIGKRDYAVRFTLERGVAGLEPGSKVYVGGQFVGVVSAQEFLRGADDDLQGVRVVISVEKDITLRQGAVAQLISPLLGGSATINFPTIGAGAPLTVDDEIDGQIAPPGMLAQAGYGPEQAEQLKRIMQRADDITAQFDSMMADARAILADAGPVVTDVRSRSTEWFDRFDSITANVDTAAARAPEIAKSMEERLATLRELIDENRENVRETLANARSISDKADQFMDRLNGELTDMAKGFIEDGRAALANASDAVDNVKSLLGEQSPNIRRSMANFRLASDGLTAMMNEVRRSPWRLLYRPDKREMDFELLYDSARAYAGAVSDLRSTSETVQSIAQSGADNATLTTMITDLESAFDRYKTAESEFLRQIMLKSE